MKKIKILFTGIIVCILLVIGITVIIDPLYVYHGPVFGMNEVLFDSTLQVEGTIRNFDYNSVLIGSSMVENADTTILDEQYLVKTLKVTKESGSLADLLLYLNEAHKYQELQYVFLGLDIFAIDNDVEPSIPADYTPEYLFTKTVLDDAKYLLNKDILLEKIPLFLAYEMGGKYSGDKTYYFAEGKNFSKEGALANYDRLEEICKPQEINKENIDKNIDNLIKEIESNPKTSYKIFYQPYSMLWWEDIYRSGKYESYFYALEESLNRLVKIENVQLYYFLADEEIVMNLDNYMDTMHFRPDINQRIIKSLNLENEHLVKKSEVKNLTNKTREMFNSIIQESL